MNTRCTIQDRTEQNLTTSDLEYIRGLTILTPEEKIIFFESSGGIRGFKQNGNFLTNKRIASYWLEENSKETHSAFWESIDSIQLNNNTRTLTYASVIKVFPHGNEAFDVYFDVDSTRLTEIYATALKMSEK